MTYLNNIMLSRRATCLGLTKIADELETDPVLLFRFYLLPEEEKIRALETLKNRLFSNQQEVFGSTSERISECESILDTTLEEAIDSFNGTGSTEDEDKY